MLVILLFTMLSACGDPTATTAPIVGTTATTTNTATSAALSTSPLKLTFSTWGNDAQNKIYQDLAVKFKEKYPNITVDVQAIPFADYSQKL